MTPKVHRVIKGRRDLLYDPKGHCVLCGGFDPVFTSKGHGVIRVRHDLSYEPKGQGDLCGRFDLFMTQKVTRSSEIDMTYFMNSKVTVTFVVGLT